MIHDQMARGTYIMSGMIPNNQDALAQTLKERTCQLETVTREYEQFASSVSHDLRAPLRALEGFTQILIEDHGDKLDGDARHCLDVIASNSRKISLLIDDLLVFSRLGRQPLHPGPVDMAALINRIVNAARPASSRVAFKVAALPPAWGDAALLETAWSHLIDNAIKFTRGQPAPVVEITGSVADGVLTCQIADNGAGFEMKYAGQLFNVFHRLHAEEEFEGRGIGLACVQRVIHRHGGKIWAQSQPGRGAAFFFTLPVKP
jgi:light-regulated signal transduction histidine kinase (bacteriophytochrome)